jgi:hypothetical protein
VKNVGYYTTGGKIVDEADNIKGQVPDIPHIPYPGIADLPAEK